MLNQIDRELTFALTHLLHYPKHALAIMYSILATNNQYILVFGWDRPFATLMWALWHLIILKSMAITYLSQLLLNNSNHCKNTAKVAGTFAASKSCCNITVLSFCILTVETAVVEYCKITALSVL